MDRFSAETTRTAAWAMESVILRDAQAGSWAALLPGAGCDLVQFGAKLDGREVEAFLQPSDEAKPHPVGAYGAPVLFPFPNRLRGGHADFEGKTIQIDLAPGQSNAIHGLVRLKPWRIDQLGAADAAVARCSVESDADTLRQFPFPFRLALSFHLSGSRLRLEIEAQNVGDSPMPMGFGWHPYFRLPFLPGTDRGADLVEVPADRLWTLDSSLIPTGETIPVPPNRDFQRLRPIDGEHLDDVYTDVHVANGRSTCRLRDPRSGVTLAVSAGPSFREWVVYAPPQRPTLCFEPYTCPTDAFNLQSRGVDAGVIVLPAGAAWRDWIELELSS